MTHPSQPTWTPDTPGAVPPSSAPVRRGVRRRRPLRRVLVALAVVLVVLAALLGAYGLLLARTFDEHRATTDVGALEDPGDGPMNLLLLGSDSREGEDAAEAGQRSDTMMLVHVPEDRHTVYVVSLLRDSYVDIPGHGSGRINSALQLGGYPLVVDTVEQLAGVPVHHVAELDFQGFRGVTNALGGVEVCNPQAFSSGQVAPSYYPRGEVLLQDTAALRYVRERHAFGDGDVTRVENQQRYVKGALARFARPDVFLNPARTTGVVSALAEHVAVDEGLTSGAVASLLWQLRGVDREDIEMFSVPTDGFETTDAGQAVVRLDEGAMTDLRAALQADDLDAYLAEHGDGAPTATGPDRAEADPAGVDPAPLLTTLAVTGAEADPCDS